MKIYDIAVIGGGASGLMAAISAAAKLRRLGKCINIAVIERNARAGKKILMTGNGRCNLTNAGVSVSSYCGDTGFLKPVLNEYGAEKILDIFKNMGLLCRETDGGRIYPYNMQASAVLSILLRRLGLYNIEILCGFEVSGVKKGGRAFEISSRSMKISARRVIFAFGGKACPQSGSDGKCFTVLRSLGHTVTRLSPSLVAVKTDPKRVRPLKGVRSMVSASFAAGGKPLKTEKGEVQFTENSLSGICIFNLSRFAGKYKSNEKPVISLDFMPEYTVNDIYCILSEECMEMKKIPSMRLADGFLNKAAGTEIIKSAVSEPSKCACELKKGEIYNIAKSIKSFVFPVAGTLPWEKAQVTAGGVPLSEVNADMSSKVCKGIYLCGELLNIDGICGGFNLHWAWASGYIAGKSAAESLQ